MALTVLTSPSNTSSVSSEMIFVIEEATKANDPTNYPNYKYVLDIYVSSTLVRRLRVPPDLNGLGVFDVSAILQSYVSEYAFDITTDIVDYDIRLAYQCKLGEEYGDTLYLNLVTDSERYTFKTYKQRPFTNSNVIANGLASNMPSILTSYTPSLHNIIPYFSNVTGVPNLVVTYKDVNGSTINTTTFDNSTFVANKLRQFNVLNSSTVTDHALFTGPFTLRINYVCTKYTPYTLVWLNPFGGYESQQFGLVSKKTLSPEKKTYSQKQYRISDAGVLSYSDAGSVLYGGKKGFATIVKTRLKLTSHLLTDAEYTWLADLFISPQVYIYTSVGFTPVIIKGDYEYRNYLNSKLTPLEFEVEFEDYNSQIL
jgi:hypothetical protein